MWRRICQGNKTDQGARVTERLLTVIQTCRMQGRDPIEFLTQAKGFLLPRYYTQKRINSRKLLDPPERIVAPVKTGKEL